jgi:hypothetical protein
VSCRQQFRAGHGDAPLASGGEPALEAPAARARAGGAAIVGSEQWDIRPSRPQCFSAGTGPTPKGKQCMKLAGEFALMQGFASAPIGTALLLAFSLLHQSAGWDSAGRPTPVLKHVG